MLSNQHVTTDIELSLLSTGRKDVSRLLSKPAPNSICGTVQLPKSPRPSELELLGVVGVEAETEVAVDAGKDVELDDPVTEPVPGIGMPEVSRAGISTNPVGTPKASLNASAWAPVSFGAAEAAARAVTQVDWAL